MPRWAASWERIAEVFFKAIHRLLLAAALTGAARAVQTPALVHWALYALALLAGCIVWGWISEHVNVWTSRITKQLERPRFSVWNVAIVGWSILIGALVAGAAAGVGSSIVKALSAACGT